LRLAVMVSSAIPVEGAPGLQILQAMVGREEKPPTPCL
jgi:hypothetical protein